MRPQSGNYFSLTKEDDMKFLVSWTSAPGVREEGYKGFAQMSDADHAADHAGVTIIGRWHNLGQGSGLAICESDDAAAVHAWAFNWNKILDIDVAPVLDDDEARAVVKAGLGL
jgi:hypothetical protein|tara:strand:+ start:229 stop:567 length:339 start_codon:yes stop_codon:yes gene_type:complete